MDNPIIRFKAVSYNPDKTLTSLNEHREFTVTYEIGEWVEAPVGGLLVYGDRDFALDNICNSVCVYTCEVRGPVRLPRWRAPLGALDVYKEIWDDAFPSFLNCPDWPRFTEAWRSVKLLELIGPVDSTIK